MGTFSDMCPQRPKLSSSRRCSWAEVAVHASEPKGTGFESCPVLVLYSSLSISIYSYKKCVLKLVPSGEASQATLLKMLSCAAWGVPGLMSTVLAKKSSIVKLCYKTALLGEPYLRQPGHVVPWCRGHQLVAIMLTPENFISKWGSIVRAPQHSSEVICCGY